MANKKFLRGILATVLAFSMAVAGCDSGSDEEENTDPKKITITGVTGDGGTISLADASMTTIAAGSGAISNGTLTVSLKEADEDGNPTESDWTGTGSCIVMLFIGNTPYAYTGGKTLEELGVTSQSDANKLPKYSISNTVSTIAFTQFMNVFGLGSN